MEWSEKEQNSQSASAQQPLNQVVPNCPIAASLGPVINEGLSTEESELESLDPGFQFKTKIGDGVFSTIYHCVLHCGGRVGTVLVLVMIRRPECSCTSR